MIMAGQEPGFESGPWSLTDNARGAKGLNPWRAPGECPGLKLDALMGETVVNVQLPDEPRRRSGAAIDSWTNRSSALLFQ
jgi:hypothetical protein